MEDAELSAGRWSGLTVLTIVVLGSWVLSAGHSGWIDVGLLGLLPDAILFPLVLLVLSKCGFGTRAVMITTLIMVVGFLSFWILCVTYALTATWWAAIATSGVGAGLLFELTKRYLRNRAQLRAEEVSARGGANRQIDARRSKQKNRYTSHDPLSSDAHAPRRAASQYTSPSRTAVRGRPSRQPASDPAPKPRSSGRPVPRSAEAMHHRLMRLMRNDDQQQFDQHLRECFDPSRAAMLETLSIYADRYGELVLYHSNGSRQLDLDEQRTLASAVLADPRFLADQDPQTLTVVIARMGSGFLYRDRTEAMMSATVAATVVATEQIPLDEIFRFDRSASAAARKTVARVERAIARQARSSACPDECPQAVGASRLRTLLLARPWEMSSHRQIAGLPSCRGHVAAR